MSRDETVSVLDNEREELYILLVSQESRLGEELTDLKLRLERDLYRDHSIAEMESLIHREGNIGETQ